MNMIGLWIDMLCQPRISCTIEILFFPHPSAMLQTAKPTDELQTKSASMAAQSVFS